MAHASKAQGNSSLSYFCSINNLTISRWALLLLGSEEGQDVHQEARGRTEAK